eukprot:scaffold12228_cov297-Chaetoceros_neogracile.AAC.2
MSKNQKHTTTKKFLCNNQVDSDRVDKEEKMCTKTSLKRSAASPKNRSIDSDHHETDNILPAVESYAAVAGARPTFKRQKILSSWDLFKKEVVVMPPPARLKIMISWERPPKEPPHQPPGPQGGL